VAAIRSVSEMGEGEKNNRQLTPKDKNNNNNALVW
jgi:hypothetical protein